MGAPTGIALRTRSGIIVREDEYDDHFIVRLDIPARYRHVDGEDEELSEIVVLSDNLRLDS